MMIVMLIIMVKSTFRRSNSSSVDTWAGFLWNTCCAARLINALISWNRKYGIGPPEMIVWYLSNREIVWLNIFVFILTTMSAGKYLKEDDQQKSGRSDLKNIKIFCPSDSPQYICTSLWHLSDIFTTAPSLLQICTSSCGQVSFIAHLSLP